MDNEAMAVEEGAIAFLSVARPACTDPVAVLRLGTQDGKLGPPLTMQQALNLSSCLANVAATMGR